MELLIKAFVGPYCPSCESVVPDLIKLIENYHDVGNEVINAYVELDQAKKYQIEAIPTIFFIKNSNVVAKVVGEHPTTLYQEIIERWK